MYICRKEQLIILHSAPKVFWNTPWSMFESGGPFCLHPFVSKVYLDVATHAWVVTASAPVWKACGFATLSTGVLSTSQCSVDIFQHESGCSFFGKKIKCHFGVQKNSWMDMYSLHTKCEDQKVCNLHFTDDTHWQTWANKPVYRQLFLQIQIFYIRDIDFWKAYIYIWYSWVYFWDTEAPWYDINPTYCCIRSGYGLFS